MKYKKFEYFAFVDSQKSPGVAKKIDNTVLAVSRLGLEASSYFYPVPDFRAKESSPSSDFTQGTPGAI